MPHKKKVGVCTYVRALEVILLWRDLRLIFNLHANNLWVFFVFFYYFRALAGGKHHATDTLQPVGYVGL